MVRWGNCCEFQIGNLHWLMYCWFYITFNKWLPFCRQHFKRIFLNENYRIFINISLNFVRKCPFLNKWSLAHVMTWRWKGDKPLPEATMTILYDAKWRHQMPQYRNSRRPGDAYMHQWTRSALVQVMACCLKNTSLLLDDNFQQPVQVQYNHIIWNGIIYNF